MNMGLPCKGAIFSLEGAFLSIVPGRLKVKHFKKKRNYIKYSNKLKQTAYGHE